MPQTPPDSTVSSASSGRGRLAVFARLRGLLPATRFGRALGGIVAVSFLYMMWITWTQLAAHRVYLADVGVFDVVLSSWRHGHFLRSPLQWDVEGANYFAAHFRPIFLALMPFYLLHDGALTYLTLQNLALALAAVPLGWLARELTQSGALGLAAAVLYLANHFTGSIHLANHPEAFAIPFWFLLFWAVQKRSVWLVVVGALGVLSVKEDMPLYLFAFGMALLLDRDRWKLRAGLVMMAGSVLAFFFALWVMQLSGQAAYHAAGNQPMSRFESMGSGEVEIILYALTNPHEVAARVFRPSLFWLYASVGFVALRDWRVAWLPLAGALPVLMADDVFLAEMRYYYSYGAVPFLFYAAVRGLALLRTDLERLPVASRGPLVLACAVFAIAVANAFLPTRTDDHRRVPFQITEHHRTGREVIARIPRDVSIAVQYDLFNRVPNREVKLPLQPWAIDYVDYVLLDLHGRAPDLMQASEIKATQALFEHLWSDEFEDVIGDRRSPDMTGGYLLLRRANTTE